jgi:hypothetical protein
MAIKVVRVAYMCAWTFWYVYVLPYAFWVVLCLLNVECFWAHECSLFVSPCWVFFCASWVLNVPVLRVSSVSSKGFWRWCITPRITGVLDFVHRPWTKSKNPIILNEPYRCFYGSEYWVLVAACVFLVSVLEWLFICACWSVSVTAFWVFLVSSCWYLTFLYIRVMNGSLSQNSLNQCVVTCFCVCSFECFWCACPSIRRHEYLRYMSPSR